MKGYPFEVLLPQGFRVSGAILADQIKRLDWRARQAKRMDGVPAEVIEEVLAKIQTFGRDSVTAGGYLRPPSPRQSRAGDGAALTCSWDRGSGRLGRPQAFGDPYLDDGLSGDT